MNKSSLDFLDTEATGTQSLADGIKANGFNSDSTRDKAEMSTKLYHLFIRCQVGGLKKLTGYAMTHAQCCVMKSKFSDWSQARILFMESPQ